ncbi:MAG: ribosome maturation factor RimM [Bulleidia sp.]
MDKYIRIGKMINTHGIKGEIKIWSYSDFDDERYVKGNTVYMKVNGEMMPLTVKSYRVHKGFPLVSFEELKDINAVEKYKECELYITDDMRDALEEGYYYDELEGLDAFDQNGNRLGITIGIEETNGAQDNLRIETGDGKSFLVPYIDEFILEVDLDENRIVIAMQEGLL